jgi:adenine-specific DNA-methyltransferase
VAAIDDLISQIEDKALRDRLKNEVDCLAKEKKFGLVFEEHLPELTPVYSAPIRRGSIVALRDQALTDTWRVISVEGDKAHCVNRMRGVKQEFDVAVLVGVLQFGEPMFPSLIPVDRVEHGGIDGPWHTLIEADNYHALQLLEYLYAGQVDCIYIDPPYNTGARDWKYNNDYVDANDRWRHSKWLAMMKRRLRLARRLLKPDIGVLIVTIDEHEVHHLGMLLEQMFPDATRQMATIVINQKGVSQGRLARTEEYALFVFMPDAYLKTHPDDLLSPDRSNEKRFQTPRWERLLRGGTNSRREDRRLLFYPIFVDRQCQAIRGVGEPLPLDQAPDLEALPEGTVAWPIRTNGSCGRWRVSPLRFKELVAQGFARLGGYDQHRRTWTVLYLNRATRTQITNGEIVIVGRDEQSGAVHIEYAHTDTRLQNIKTVWHRSLHDSGIYGSSLLKSVLGASSNFSFPKSLYATRDAIATVVRDRPNALTVDFFAGSGTTLNAVNLLNATDGGRRRCILVTNNEVSEEDAKELTAQGYCPGNPAWEQRGICRSVTWPRAKYTILGQRDDGTELEGAYLTGKSLTKETPRRFRHIGFIEPTVLTTVSKKKQLVALIEGIPQSDVQQDTAFVVTKKNPASILFDEEQAEEWLTALEDQDHITDFYIVTQRTAVFDALKTRIVDLLGPTAGTEEEKRPLREGLAANLEYFKLDFLEKNQVVLGKRFREILPLLWLKAGAIGPRPQLPESASHPDILIPEHNPFAVLLNESKFVSFARQLADRRDITHLFLVTDSEDAFREMTAQLGVPHTVQLYRDYLENFVINKRGEA